LRPTEEVLMSGADTGTTAAGPEVPPADAVVPETPAGAGTLETNDHGETRSERFSRLALRGRLYAYTIAVVALVAVLIALAASNTVRVRVHWLFGSSTISLVWLVLVVALLGWTLGLLTSARLHSLTRAPRPPRRSRGRRTEVVTGSEAEAGELSP
jgi:uncharacterized integral membrane protein